MIATFRSMGCEVVLGGEAAERRDEIEALFAERDARFSRFRADSELCRVNRAGAPVVGVSAAFARAVATALEAADATGGLVDPTLLGALEAAGYDDDFAALRDDPRPRGPAQRGARGAVSLAGRMLARPPGLGLDLAGVVKGMAVDDALALTRGPAFVSAGGDLAARGGVDVALPRGGSVRLVAGALATSGSASRRWRRGGVLNHHLIDPRTGRPSASCWEQVTVCGATCVAADVAAKAAFLAGEDGPAWLEARGLPGRFVGAGIVTTPAWARTTAAACT